MKVLIVDDEPDIRETVEFKLRREGYTTFTAPSAEEALRLVRLVRPDLIVLDVMLPARSGFDLARALRRDSQVPIIFISARASEVDRITGLDLGGDDYLVKPFSLSELAARVKSVLRRSGGGARQPRAVEIGNLRIDPAKHEVTVEGSPITLAPKEFALLAFLAENPGQVFSREALLDRVWGADAYVTPRTIDVHIRWIRERIESDPSKPERLLTIRGVGYKFVG